MNSTRFILLLGWWVTACAPLQSLLAPAETESTGIAWQEIAPGLELVSFNGSGALPSRITALRVEPDDHLFRVHYRPEEPASSAVWQQELAAAAAIINANFYDRDGFAMGWLVEEGVSRVPPRTGYGGALMVSADAVRVLPRAAPGQAVEQAVQGFPNLVRSGAAADRLNDLALARRTVVAEDREGRILFFQVGGIGMTLAGFANWLVEQPLEILNAVNLDGGGSSLLLVRGIENALIHSRDPVPAVVAVYPRHP